MDNKEAVEILDELPDRIVGVILPSDRFYDYKEALNFAVEHLEADRWIPVSERLPNDRDWYLGVFKEPDTGFIGIPYICDYVGEITNGTTNEGWILRHCTDVDNASAYFRNLICVAWKPLPKPYESEAEV